VLERAKSGECNGVDGQSQEIKLVTEIKLVIENECWRLERGT
jgi:hypothetical protein